MHSKQVTTNWRGSHVYNAPALLSSPLRDPRACASTRVCMYMFSLFRGGTRRARVHATTLPSLLSNLAETSFARATKDNDSIKDKYLDYPLSSIHTRTFLNRH